MRKWSTDSEYDKCLSPECKNCCQYKGLCSSCYGSAKQLINDEKTTWEELAGMGLADVSDKPLLAAFLARKQAPAVAQCNVDVDDFEKLMVRLIDKLEDTFDTSSDINKARVMISQVRDVLRSVQK